MNNKTICIKIIKDHVSGLKKGDLRLVNRKVADKFINDKMAVESTEKERLKYIESKKVELEKSYKAAQKKEKVNLKARTQKVEKTIEKDKATETVEETFLKIEELDLEANPFLSEQGIKVGDCVLANEDGTIIIDKDGKATIKPAK